MIEITLLLHIASKQEIDRKILSQTKKPRCILQATYIKSVKRKSTLRSTYRLVIDCPDQTGLVAAVSQFLAEHGANILEASHHTDLQLNRFFMRHEIDAESIAANHKEFVNAFSEVAQRYEMRWKLNDSAKKANVALLASKESHCLIDVLHRWHTGELQCNIPCIIANHETMREYADWYKVPFHFIDFSDKQRAFDEIECLLNKY